jgi:hypothetical protein
MTSSRLLRLHIDRGLERHGYPWSPPTRVPEVSVKWTWPARSPVDMKVDPETLSTTQPTLEDSRRPYPDPGGSAGLVAQDSPPGCGSAPPLGPKIMGFTI